MNRCEGVVIVLENDEVWVEIAARAPSCGQCRQAGSCAEGLAGEDGPRRYRIANRIGARIGDRVSLAVADGIVWRAALASYGVPLLLALAGAIGGQALGGDAWALSGMLTGLAAGLLLLRRRELAVRRDGRLVRIETRNQTLLEEPK